MGGVGVGGVGVGGVGDTSPSTVKKIAVGGPHAPLLSSASTKSVCCPGAKPSRLMLKMPLCLGTVVRSSTVFGFDPVIQDGLSIE